MKFDDIVFYGLVIVGIIIGLGFGLMIIGIFYHMINEYLVQTAICIGLLIWLLLMIYCIKKVRGETDED